MPDVTTVRPSATLRAGHRADARSRMMQALLALATAVSVLALALLTLLLPAYMHPALDLAAAPNALAMTSEEARAMSDRTVTELLFGPGTFRFEDPSGQTFYGAAEAAHMQDVRLVLYAFLSLALASGALLLITALRARRDPSIWQAIARGGAGLAVGLGVVGAFALLAFNVAFELFHQLLFPGGNWVFDPASQRLVQLYPLAFWQLTAAALGVLGIGGGLAVWAVAGRRARRLASER